MGNMFSNFSRFADSGRRRPGSRDRRRYEPDYGYDRRDRYYEPEYDGRRPLYDYDRDLEEERARDREAALVREREESVREAALAREREESAREREASLVREKAENAATIKEMGRERSDLQAQVAELKQQVELLNSLMEKKDNQLKEFEEAMENNNSEQINNLIVQINDRFSKLESKMDADTGRNDQMVNVISENVHNESVKCYRNIQVILEEIQKKLDIVENKKVSLLGTTACVVITMLLSLGNLALLVLRILGIV
ncbi:MAG: hypothetical protein IK152_09580 [Lachnospiraceae bacterium]|nr:hypothetical protein [Lachnospiraceae bacterium]